MGRRMPADAGRPMIAAMQAPAPIGAITAHDDARTAQKYEALTIAGPHPVAAIIITPVSGIAPVIASVITSVITSVRSRIAPRNRAVALHAPALRPDARGLSWSRSHIRRRIGCLCATLAAAARCPFRSWSDIASGRSLHPWAAAAISRGATASAASLTSLSLRLCLRDVHASRRGEGGDGRQRG